jgi:hypothetical protein
MTVKKKKVQDILEDLAPLLSAHDCTMELGEVSGDRVVIYCGGEGAVCDSKCVEEVIKQKFPGIEIIFR